MSNKNVLYTVDHLGLGGVQTGSLKYLPDLKGSGKYNILVCCLRWPTPIGEKLESSGIHVVFLHRNAFDPRQLLDVIKLIRKEKIDLVHANLHADMIICRMAALICRVPHIVAHDHSGNWIPDKIPYLLKWLYLFIDDVLTFYTDRIICVSESVRECRMGRWKADPDKIEIVYNCVDTVIFDSDRVSRVEIRAKLGIRPSALVIGTTGRLAPVKGQIYFLESAAEIIERFSEAVFLIVGDGPMRAELEQKARDLGISEKVIFTGFRDDIPELLAAMDVFVFPSLHEPLANSLLEAMAMEKPVVATNVGGNPEVVVDGVTGSLVLPADSKSLTMALADLLTNPEKRRRFGKSGRQRVTEHFSKESMVSNIERIYDEIFAKKE
jgi:glycosyltransferase involved in cell wall biosynthesis